MSAGHEHHRRNMKNSVDLARLLKDTNIKALMAIEVRIDRTYDLPFLSGYSKNGRTIFIDRHLPERILINDQEIDVVTFLVVHERVESALIAGAGFDYQDAHEYATAAEHDHVRAAGIKPYQYEDAIESFIKGHQIEKLLRTPTDLDLSPYKTKGCELLLKHLQKIGDTDRSARREWADQSMHRSEPKEGSRPRSEPLNIRALPKMVRLDPKLTILGGIVIAIVGFLTMGSYFPREGIVWNVMTRNIEWLDIPYRHILICSVLLVGIGLFRLWRQDE
jgi:hypothetical protein